MDRGRVRSHVRPVVTGRTLPVRKCPETPKNSPRFRENNKKLLEFFIVFLSWRAEKPPAQRIILFEKNSKWDTVPYGTEAVPWFFFFDFNYLTQMGQWDNTFITHSIVGCLFCRSM